MFHTKLRAKIDLKARQSYWQPGVHKPRTLGRRGTTFFTLAPRFLKCLLDFWKNCSPLLKTIAISSKFRLETTCYACYRLRRRKLIWIKLKMKRRRNEAVFAEKSLLYRDLTRPFALHNMKASFVLAAQSQTSNVLRPRNTGSSRV